MSFVIFYLLASFISLVARILFCLAIDNDAKARGLKNRTVFAVLAFFFPLIVGIVYLCVRNTAVKSVPKMCCNCGATLAPEYTQCPNCGGFLFRDYIVTGADSLKRSAKNFLIFSIILVIASGIFSVCGPLSMIDDIIEHGNDKSYEDFLEKFSNGDWNFDDFVQDQQDGDSQKSDEQSDFEKFGSQE